MQTCSRGIHLATSPLASMVTGRAAHFLSGTSRKKERKGQGQRQGQGQGRRAAGQPVVSEVEIKGLW